MNNFFSAGLFAKSKNVMLSHLFADAIEEEGKGAGGGGGKKKGGGSMQTISATHRVSCLFLFSSSIYKTSNSSGTIKQIDEYIETNSSSFRSLYHPE
jgi:hypothetical protein